MIDNTLDKTTKSQTSLGITFGAGAGALWGLVFLAPEILKGFSPVEMSAGRYLAYGAISAAMILPNAGRLLRTVRLQDWIALFWLALFGNTLYYALLSMAVLNGGIAQTSLIIGFLPVAIMIIGSRQAGAVPFKALIPSIALCAAGAVCCFMQAAAARHLYPHPLIGALSAAGALASWTGFAVSNSRHLKRLHATSAHEWNLLTGLMTGAQALVMAVASMLLTEHQHTPAQWELFGVVSISVAACASILGNILWNKMSRLLPLTMVGQMILFETLFALIYGLIWEHRLPRVTEIVSFLLVIASVLACVSGHAKHTHKPNGDALTIDR